MTLEPKMRVVIVDDEPLALRRVRRMLARHSDVEIVGDATNGNDAALAIGEKSPDLVFLDVQMPEVDGFAVLDKIAPDRAPLVIFVTAYDQYALRAFEVCALDYLLKPFDRARFDKALERARARFHSERQPRLSSETIALLSQLNSRRNHLERFMVRSGGRTVFIKTQEIDWIEAEGKYVRLHVGKESYLVREPISGLEAQLSPAEFARIHRSTMVNIDRIKELQSMFHNEYQVVLRDGTELMLSRGYRKRLGEFLGGAL